MKPTEIAELTKAVTHLTTEIVALRDILHQLSQRTITQRGLQPLAATPLPPKKEKEWKCPVCDARMIKRTRKLDRNEFWGCSNYPNCYGSRNIDGSITSTPLNRTFEEEPEF